MKKSEESGIPEDAFKRAREDDAAIKPLQGRGSQYDETSQTDNDAVSDIVEQAKQVQRVAEKIYFLSILKRFGLAFGGILLLLGTISATAFFLLFFGVFPTDFPRNTELLLEIGLALMAMIHILAGLALLAG